MEKQKENQNGIKVSYFEKFKYVKDALFEEIIKAIKTEHWSKEIDPIREAKARGDDIWKKLKDKLPGFTPSGTFDKKKAKENLKKYSQIIVLDIDDLAADKVEQMREMINTNKHTLASFVSPSGEGIKFFICVDSEQENHDEAYGQLADHFENLLEHKIDRSGKDFSRYCFISSDKSAYYNDRSEVFKVEQGGEYVEIDEPRRIPRIETQEVVQFQDGSTQFEKAVALTLNKMQFFEGNRNTFVRLLAGNCNRWGIPEHDALRLIIGSTYCYDEKEIESTVYSAYTKVHEHNKFPLKNRLVQTDPIVEMETESKKFAALPLRDFAEVEVSTEEYDENSPNIPSYVYENLPDLIKKGTDAFDDKRRRDVFLTGVLGVLSGCFTNISGIYDKRRVWSNLYVFITAPFACGKGVLLHAKEYGMGLHSTIRADNPGDKETPQAVLYIPGNTSAGAMINHLQVNNGYGIFFESEADSLNNAIKNEWGNFSDVLRKAFHHEPYTQSRKGNNEYIEINRPKLSLVLSGTPEQVQTLTRSVEDGLFSRIIFYSFESDYEWRDVSTGDENESHDEFFEKLGIDVYKTIKGFLKINEVTFDLTKDQWQELNNVQRTTLRKVIQNQGRTAASLIMRMGLMWYKIAMVLSEVRAAENSSTETKIICSDIDFNISKQLMETYKVHILSVYESMPKNAEYILNKKMYEFYNSLPDTEIQRMDAIKIGLELKIRERESDDFLSKLFKLKKLEKPKTGFYTKVK